MNKKGKGFYTIYAVLILVLLFAVGYFILQKNYLRKVGTNEAKPSPENSLPSPVPTPVEDREIPKSWKTYRSQRYNFEFSYPPETRLSDQSEGYVAVSFMGDKQKASGRTQTELFDGYSFNVADVTGGGYGDLDDFYAQKVIQLKDICTEIGNPKETTISGKRAITQRLSCMNEYDAYYVLVNDRYFEISLFQVGEAEDLPAYAETVNKIFSTFRFID